MKKEKVLNLFTSDAQKSFTDFNLEKNELFSDISLFKDRTQSELYDFKNKIEQDLSYFKKTKSDEIYNKREEAKKHLSQKIDSRLDKITEEQSAFLDRQNRLIQQQKTLIDNLSSQLDTLQRISEKDRNEKTESINSIDEYIRVNIEPKVKYCETELIRGNIKVNKKIEEIENSIAEKAKRGIFGILK